MVCMLFMAYFFSILFSRTMTLTHPGRKGKITRTTNKLFQNPWLKENWGGLWVGDRGMASSPQGSFCPKNPVDQQDTQVGWNLVTCLIFLRLVCVWGGGVWGVGCRGGCYHATASPSGSVKNLSANEEIGSISGLEDLWQGNGNPL